MEDDREAGGLKPKHSLSQAVTGGSLNDILHELRPVGLNTAPAARGLNCSLIGDIVVTIDAGLDIAELSTVRQA